MRLLKIDMDGSTTVVSCHETEFESCTQTLLDGNYRMVSGDSDLSLDGTIMLCDREEMGELEQNPFAVLLHTECWKERSLRGPVVVTKLAKGESGYCICDLADWDLCKIEKELDKLREVFDGTEG